MHDTPRLRQIAAFVVGISLFWAALYVYVPTLAVHARHLGATDTMIGLVVGSYGLTQLLLRIPLGILSDRLAARRPFVLFGFAAASLSGIGLALSRHPADMLLARATAGIAASSWVASTVLFASFFPPTEAVRATSIMSFASSSGQMVATLGGGYIADAWGTRTPFLVGAVIAVAGMLAIGATKEKTAGRDPAPSFRQIVDVLTLPSLLAVSAVAAIVQYASFATSFAFVPIYASEVLGLSSAHLGILTSAVMIPYTITATIVAGLVTRVREEKLVALGLLILSLSTAATPFVRNFPALLTIRTLFGVGSALTYPILMGLSIRAVPQSQRASAMGAFQAIYALGMTTGPALSGFIADRLGLVWVFWATALMCVVALFPLRVTRSGRSSEIPENRKDPLTP